VSEDVKDFAGSFKAFMDQMSREAESDEPLFFPTLLGEHFGSNAEILPVVSCTFATYQHPSFQLALDELLERRGKDVRMVGYKGELTYTQARFSHLLNSGNYIFSEGPVTYASIETGPEETYTVTNEGLVLLVIDGEPFSILISGPTDHARQLRIEIMAKDKSGAEQLLHSLRDATTRRSVYRGKTLLLSLDMWRNLDVRTQTLPNVSREKIILPAGIIDRVERLTIHFGEVREKLLAAGRHLKRGLLLHGPPGTGKTYTAMYLASAMRDRTVLLLTGQSQGLLQQCAAMARALQPAMVVIEDVDLIAEERTRQSRCSAPLLFELLNEMDGLADDCDVIFLLTTNRPDILEPALAARPGRIDQAIEIPLPDADCRRRLFELYARGTAMQLTDEERFIVRTEGASAAFIKELFRRASLFSIDGSDKVEITDNHLDMALHELVAEGGSLTQSLLGFSHIKPSSS
jgi:hypothetical protein